MNLVIYVGSNANIFCHDNAAVRAGEGKTIML